MSDKISQLKNLPLSELIGGPLAAMVEAESIAAQTTVDYLEQVGFVNNDEKEDGGGLGRLRMARFRYTKLDEEGSPAEFEVQIPALSLVPIPGVRIKSGKIAFTARIIDIDPPEEETKTTSPKKEPLRLALHPYARLRGGFAPRRQSTVGESKGTRGSFEIDIEIEVEQQPIAPGLESILTTFEQAILHGRVEKDREKEND